MKASDIYQEVVSRFVAPLLERKGFKRGKKDWFFHWEGESLWRVATGFRKVPDRDEGWLSITVCVGFKDLASFLQDFSKEDIKGVNEPCIMATDIGHLKPPYSFFEYRLLPDINTAFLGSVVTNDIETFLLPYFTQYGDLEKALAAWENGITYNLGAGADLYIASAYWLRGDQKRAIEFIENKIAYYDGLYRERNRRSDVMARAERERFLAFLLSHNQ